MMRYEDDFTGMQSDMFTQDPMSAKSKKKIVYQTYYHKKE